MPRLVLLATLGLVSLFSLPSAAARKLDASSKDTIDHSPRDLEDPFTWNHVCPQLGPLLPSKSKFLSQMEEYLDTDKFFESSVKRLAGAIKINTTSNDGMQELSGHDPEWSHMFAFSEYLAATFPLIHRMLALERVNTHGLLYTWHGKNQSLDPILLLAHQDVVPIQHEAESM